VTAFLTVVGPKNFSSKFVGFHPLNCVSAWSKIIGESMTIEAGVNPFSSAAV